MTRGEIFNGRLDTVYRVYGTLRFFTGENRVYPYGDILFVATQNNEDYDLILHADGVSCFVDLYNAHKDDPMPPSPSGGGGTVTPNSVSTSAIIDGTILMEDLNDEVKDNMRQTYDESTETIYINGAKPQSE